jgi:hypothetical protein
MLNGVSWLVGWEEEMKTASTVFVAFLLSGCVMDAHEGTQLSNSNVYTDSADSDIVAMDDVEPLAAEDSTDYSYFTATEICQVYGQDEYYDANYEWRLGYIENTSSGFLRLACTIPSVYYNNVGYDASEIDQITVYGRNRNNEDGIYFDIILWTRSTLDEALTERAVARLNYTTYAITTDSFDDPGIPFEDPFVVLYVWIPGSDESNSFLDHFRVHYVE